MEKKSKPDCVFCKITNKEIPEKLIYESKNFMAFPDAHPTTPGHALIIPKDHYENIIDLPTALASELHLAIKKVAELRLKEGCKGFNIIVNTGKAAGQAVFHFHLHIIPRKGDEKNLKLL